MKKIKLFLCVALFGAMGFGAFSAYGYYTINDEKRFLFANIEALTSDEPGGGDDWAGKKLKQVCCTCPNGKSGTSLHCKTDGDLEPCTATQQGSKVCYKVGFSGLKLC